MDVRLQFSIAIAQTVHSSFSERKHAALEGLHEDEIYLSEMIAI